MLQFLRNTRWAILWGALIFILTGIPGGMLPRLPSYLDLFQPDKLVHLFVFGVFFILLVLSFRKPGTPLFVTRHPMLVAFLFAFFIAATTELLQEFVVPMRTASFWDFIANIVGSLLGLVLVKLVGKKGRVP